MVLRKFRFRFRFQFFFELAELQQIFDRFNAKLTEALSTDIANVSSLADLKEFEAVTQVCVLLVLKIIFSKHLFYVVWRTGTKPVLTPYDGRRQFELSGIRTYDHPYASPELYHCATDANFLIPCPFPSDPSLSGLSLCSYIKSKDVCL